MTALSEKACDACVWKENCKIKSALAASDLSLNFSKFGCNRFEKGVVESD